MTAAGPPPRAGALLAALAARRATVAVAESVTGGMLAAALVAPPGASAVFRGGLVVYATDLKTTLAGVDADLLASVGPVHADVAVALAVGARVRCGATWALSTTGVAGPDPAGGHPPGTVFLGIAGPDGAAARRLHLAGSRDRVRADTVSAALDLLAGELARSS